MCYNFYNLDLLFLVGGESFPTKEELLAWKVPQKVSVYNIYGLTEISCWATINKVWPCDHPDISVGDPLSETIIKLEHCNENSVGEMYIGTFKYVNKPKG